MARQRPPTDEQKTEIYDSQQRARNAKPTKRGHNSGEISRQPEIEIGTPTAVDPPRDRSEPMRVISMKTPAEVLAERKKHTAKNHRAEIRALSDVVGKNQTPPRGMGYLAPPVNLKEQSVRKLRDWLIWGSVLVIITCGVMLAVWFLAGR